MLEDCPPSPPWGQDTRVQAWTDNGQADWVEDANGNRSDDAYDGFDRLEQLYFPTDPPGKERPEFDGPAPDRLVADLDALLRQQFLDVPKAEAERELQQHGVADHISRKPVAFERNRLDEISSPTAAYADIAGDLLAFA